MSPTDPKDDKNTFFDGFNLPDEQATVLEPAEFTDDEITENTDTSMLPMALSAEAAQDPSRYQFERTLGVGGMGEVDRIADRLLGRHIARKRIKQSLAENYSIRSRFEDEARITAQLDHPGIISVHDMGIDAEGRPWFTMKEVRGKTFTRVISELRTGGMNPWLQSSGGWTLHRTIQVFRQSCEAVGYAHHRGVLHRDLKPDNIMVGDFGEVWVLDWGLAKLIGTREHTSDPERAPHISLGSSSETSRTQQGSLTGTPAFMSPEQALGIHEFLKPTSDVWSLGAVLFTLLTGQPPWFGLDIYDIVARLRAGESPRWPPNTQVNGPEILVEICQKALSPEPGQRYANGTEFGTAVADWLEGAQRRERALELIEKADLLQAQQRQADSKVDQEQEHEITRLLHAALTHAPRLPEAHSRLANYYLELHRKAETQGDHTEARRWEGLIRVHDSGQHADYLQGEGYLSLVTQPDGARLTLCRLEHRPDGITEIPVEDLGTSPIYEIRLPRGLHTIRIEADGYSPVRYPVHIGRQGHWKGIRPGDDGPTPIRLLPQSDLEPDDCYVPSGWFIGGSEHEILDCPIPRGWYWADGLICRRHPVTNAEYLEFLNDLVATGKTEDALKHVPTDAGGAEGGRMVYHQDSSGRFKLGTDPQGGVWTPHMPVVQIPVQSAMSYAEWLHEKTGKAWRLPTELEWEKVARGVDGRIYPWGPEFHSAICHHRGAIPDHLGPSEVGRFPRDQSVYGVSGMAGNIMEWTANPYPEPPLCTDQIVQISGAVSSGRQATRGGAWVHRRFFCRVDLRRSQAAWIPVGAVGFRVVRSI